MSAEEMLAAWKDHRQGNSGIGWLQFLGLRKNSFPMHVDIQFTETLRYSCFSFIGCVYLAEVMPEEFAKWIVLRRMGLVEQEEP